MGRRRAPGGRAARLVTWVSESAVRGHDGRPPAGVSVREPSHATPTREGQGGIRGDGGLVDPRPARAGEAEPVAGGQWVPTA